MFACKKTKINSTRTSVVISGEIPLESISTTAVSMIIGSNKTLKVLEDLPELTYLKLKNTSVHSIADCQSLSILTVEDNKKLECIEHLDNLFELTGTQCTKLRNINLNNLNEVALKDCTQLRTLVAPNIEIMSLIRCTKIKFPKIGSMLKTIKLHSCHSIKTLEFLQIPNLHLDHLEVNNCSNISEISGIKNCKSIVVQDCSSIQKIHSLSKIGSITIDKCPELMYINHLTKTKYCSISRCDNINVLYRVQVLTSMLVEYCPKLDAIDHIISPELIVRYCSRLARLYVNKKTTQLFLEECSMLDYIKFDPESKKKLVASKLSIVLKGIFAFSSISAWNAISLTIIDNPNLLKIDTVYDLKSLSVHSCSNIYSIKNMIIESAIDISDCSSLEEIDNIMGPETINLSNLEYLSYLGIDMTSPKHIYIENAPYLKTNLDGSNLNNLTLLNTDMILISNISPYSTIRTLNSGYLPDLETDLSVHIGFKETLEAKQLIEFDAYQRMLITRIVDNIRIHQVKKYRGRIQLALTDNYCTICMDSIDKKERFVSKCFHIFHINCISSWVAEKNTCPLCAEKSIFRSTDICRSRLRASALQYDNITQTETASTEDNPEMFMSGAIREIVFVSDNTETHDSVDYQIVWRAIEPLSQLNESNS